MMQHAEFHRGRREPVGARPRERRHRRPQRCLAWLGAVSIAVTGSIVVPLGHVSAASVQITPIRASGFVHSGDFGEPRVDITVCASFDQPVRFIEALVDISGPVFGVALDGPEHGSTTRWCGTIHDLAAGPPGAHTLTVTWRANNGNGLSEGHAVGSGSYTVPGAPPTQKKTPEQAAALGHASNAMWKAAAILAVAGVLVALAAATLATGGLAGVLVGGAIGVLGGGGAAYMAADLSDLAIDPPDSNYTQTVVSQDVALPPIAAGSGFGAASTAALNAWITHLGKEAGEARATVAALFKAEGAAQASDAGWEQTQTLATANFAHLLAVDLQAESALRAAARAALESDGMPVIALSTTLAQSALDTWRTTGLSAAQIDGLTASSTRAGLDDRLEALANSLPLTSLAQTNLLDLLAPPTGSSTPNAIEQASTQAATALQTWSAALTAHPTGNAPAGPAIITGIDPSEGPLAGGTSVTITGLNLSATTQVNFGSKHVSGGSCTDTQCVAAAPPGTGTVAVTVGSPAGTSAATPDAQFSYLSGTTGSVHLPTASAIEGGGFDPPDAKVEGSYESLAGTTGSAALGRWTISAGNVDLVGPGSGQAAEGVQFVDLNGNGSQGPGTITQSVPTVPGHRYRLSFRLAGNPNGQPTVKTLLASLGVAQQNFSFDTTGHTNLALGWTEETLETLSCADHLPVTLSSTTLGDKGPNVDAVSVVDLGLAPSGSCEAQLMSLRYVPLQPARLLETRSGPGLGTIDGQQNAIGVRQAGTVTELQVGGRAGVAADAEAVVLDVAAIDARSPGFVTAFPCGSARPNAANVTYAVGQTAPNAVVSSVGAGGKVCLFTYGTIDLAVDVDGYFPAGNPYVALQPARILETRFGAGLSTVDGLQNGIGPLFAGTVTKLHVAGRAGVAGNAAAAVLNVTAIDAQTPGFLTAYPCGANRPNAANLTYDTGQTAPNAVVAQIGTNGDICLFTYGDTDLAVDVDGYFPVGASFVPLVPVRTLETRTGPGLGTADGQQNAIGALAAGSTTRLHVTGRGGVSTDGAAVVLNVTAVAPRAAGFVTAYPCGTDRPNAASLTYSGNGNAPNAVVAQVGADGDVCLFTYAATDLVVDVLGYMP